MLESWEPIIWLIIIILVAFPLRQPFLRNWRTWPGGIIGLFLGRIGYVFLGDFFNVESILLLVIVMIISCILFAGATKDVFDRAFPQKDRRQE